MKIVFAGPTLGNAVSRVQGVEIRPPARQGDVAEAVLAGATVIGIIDGVFENVPAVWHKEILFALSEGVRVLGAGSMGALRAAECAAFGMEGVGAVFRRYQSGDLIDDDAVAQLHAPEMLGFAPLSEPLVNVEATLAALRQRELVSDAEHDRLVEAARRIFFKDRTYEMVVEEAAIDGARRQAIAAAIRNHSENPKRDDAVELLLRVASLPAARQPKPDRWIFAESRLWRELLARRAPTPAVA
jgi:hypothetical protein